MKEIKLFHKKSWWQDAILIISIAWNNLSIIMCIKGLITGTENTNIWWIILATDIATAIFMLVWKLRTWKIRYKKEKEEKNE